MSTSAERELPSAGHVGGDRPPQFGLAALLVAVTVAGVLLGLLKTLGIFGAVVAFLAAVALTLIFFPVYRPQAIAQQEALFDFIWGVIMPVICLAVDPILLKHGDVILPPRPEQPWDLSDLFTSAGYYSYSFAAYAFVAWQIALLSLALAVGRPARPLAAFLSGSFHVGYLAAGAVGVILFVPSLVGLYVGVGLLGFTPLFAAYALQRRMQIADAIAWSEGDVKRADAWFFGGIATTIALPLAVGGLALLWTHLR